MLAIYVVGVGRLIRVRRKITHRHVSGQIVRPIPRILIVRVVGVNRVRLRARRVQVSGGSFVAHQIHRFCARERIEQPVVGMLFVPCPMNVPFAASHS